MRHRFAYFPFIGGPHQCIGRDFALVEMQLILAMVVQQCRLRPTPGHQAEPDPLITLRLRGGLPMTVHSRPALNRTGDQQEAS